MAAPLYLFAYLQIHWNGKNSFCFESIFYSEIYIIKSKQTNKKTSNPTDTIFG
jgi:hypothetical protein